jgi:hypothetical protein
MPETFCDWLLSVPLSGKKFSRISRRLTVTAYNALYNSPLGITRLRYTPT